MCTKDLLRSDTSDANTIVGDFYDSRFGMNAMKSSSWSGTAEILSVLRAAGRRSTRGASPP